MLDGWISRKSSFISEFARRSKSGLRLGMAGMVGLAIVLGATTSALACTCAWDGDWTAHARSAEIIFTGKAIQRTDWQPVADSSGVIIFSSADPTVYEFEVDETLKGNGESASAQGQALQVWTVRDDASCGYNFLLDSAYLVFAYKPVGDSVLRTGSCSGNQILGSSYVDSVMIKVKAALATNAVRHSRETKRGEAGKSFASSGSSRGGTRLIQNGALQSLERRDQRIDGRHTDGRRTDGRHVWP
jgi:hypothetical protein